MKAIAPGCAAYVAIAIFSFGSVFKPIFLAFQPERLGAPNWNWIVFICFAIASLSFLIPTRLRFLRGPAFMIIGLGGSVLGVAAYADRLTAAGLEKFRGERQMRNSFIESLRRAPEEHQFFLHAAAMKDCVPYAWSYRTMNFYRVPLRAAINVMPGKWLMECSIDRKNADAW